MSQQPVIEGVHECVKCGCKALKRVQAQEYIGYSDDGLAINWKPSISLLKCIGCGAMSDDAITQAGHARNQKTLEAVLKLFDEHGSFTP